jgi:hypothetical protein
MITITLEERGEEVGDLIGGEHGGSQISKLPNCQIAKLPNSKYGHQASGIRDQVLGGGKFQIPNAECQIEKGMEGGRVAHDE